MRTITGSITEEAGRAYITWPGVEFVGQERAVFEGKEFILLDEDSFPGMAKIVTEQFIFPGGDVLVLSAEGQDFHAYDIYGRGTHFTTTDAMTGKVKVHRQYLSGVRNAITVMTETLTEISCCSSVPVEDFIDGNFGE
jgi:hypothetical protein